MTEGELYKIDAEIAIKVMEWKLVSISREAAWIPSGETIDNFKTFQYAARWLPSTSLEDAFFLVGKMRDAGYLMIRPSFV